MNRESFKPHTAMVLLLIFGVAIATGFSAVPALAAKPPWAGNDKEEHGKEKAAGKEKGKSAKPKHGKHFRAQDEDIVRRYYQHQSRSGKGCPPGLARKDNGCMPPGQAKKQWATGDRLPRDVKYHDLPDDLLSKLPMPPQGQRYVRVVADILLVDADTDIVIDALVDILIP